MAPRGRNESEDSDEEKYFHAMNEKEVDNITIDFFYKPHTLTLLSCIIVGLLYVAFSRDDTTSNDNILHGMIALAVIHMLVSVLAYPNGPFIRPHPAVWRIVFGVSVLYLLFLIFILFQSYQDVRQMIIWLDPKMANFSIDSEKEYAVDCWNLSLERLLDGIDEFCTAHFLGWVMKALLVRHYGILWTISLMWEFTEMIFSHLLPNFAECWWDMLFLDVLLCNGVGIFVGMKICKYLEMRTYHWESFKTISSNSGKFKRAVLQFTPEHWTHVRWFDPGSPHMRFISVSCLVIVWQITELNTFFLKQFFELPPSHLLCLIRLAIICLITAPTVRQYYVYATDKRCTRLGTQTWMFCAIIFTEAVICIKAGKELFAKTVMLNVILWIFIQFLTSILCVYLCAMYAKHFPDSDPFDATPQGSPEKKKPSNKANSPVEETIQAIGQSSKSKSAIENDDDLDCGCVTETSPKKLL